MAAQLGIVGKISQRIKYVVTKTIQVATLFRENGVTLPLRIIFAEALVQRRTFPVVISGISLKIRSFSSDLIIANSWLKADLADQYTRADEFDGVIIDAGGHIGMAAIAFARRFPGKKVICLEPAAENFEILSYNVKNFKNIVALHCAVGPEDGELELIDRTGSTDGFILKDDSEPLKHEGFSQSVRVTSIPSLLDEFGEQKIALLKLDIEGFEVDLLSDQPAWLHDIGLMAVELHERFRTGSTRAYVNATERGRRDFGFEGEMYFSISDQAG